MSIGIVNRVFVVAPIPDEMLQFVSSWFEKGMLFSWADTGSWESVATHDEVERRSLAEKLE